MNISNNIFLFQGSTTLDLNEPCTPQNGAFNEQIQEVNKGILTSENVRKLDENVTFLQKRRLEEKSDAEPKRFKPNGEEGAAAQCIYRSSLSNCNIPITIIEKQNLDAITAKYSILKDKRIRHEQKIKASNDYEEIMRLKPLRDRIYIKELEIQCHRTNLVRGFIERDFEKNSALKLEIESRISELEKEISQLQKVNQENSQDKQIDNHDFIIFAHAMSIKELEEKIRVLEKEKKEIRKQFEQSSISLEKSRLELIQAEDKIFLLTQKVSLLQKQMCNAQSDLEKTKLELEAMRNKCEQLELQNSKIANEVREILGDNLTLEDENKKLTKRCRELTTTVSSMKKSAEVKKERIEVVTDQLVRQLKELNG